MTVTAERVTIGYMARSWRREPKGAAALEALAAVAHAYQATEELLDKQRTEMIAAMVAARLAEASIADIARCTGYSREHASKLIAETLSKKSAEA